MKLRDRRLKSLLAAQYVAGTLSGRARRRFEVMQTLDPTLRWEVERWNNRLSPLVEALPDRQPPPGVWDSIKAGLDAPALPVETRRVERRSPERRKVAPFWRIWAGLASAVALVLALLVGYQQWGLVHEGSLEADYLAVLQDAQQRPVWLVRLDDDGQLVVEALRPQSLAVDQSLELWLLPEGDQAPLSLGLIPPAGRGILKLPAVLAANLAGAQGLAVSLEPAGGSPTGVPTGPVLVQGSVVFGGG